MYTTLPCRPTPHTPHTTHPHAQTTDIKLDNLVISADKRRLKICDFGSALLSHEIPSCRETDQLASRFYRAPEIILGYTPSPRIDVWAAGCCLFELYSGTLPFMGDDNNGMLFQFMQVLGRFPKKVLTRSRHVARHFDVDGGYNFACNEQDGAFVKTSAFGKRSLSSELLPPKDRKKMLSNPQLRTHVQKVDDLTDLLLNHLFVMDAERRSGSKAALKHGFFARPKASNNTSGRGASQSRSMSSTRR
jgi:serine/threonine-protein kinase PRP4